MGIEMIIAFLAALTVAYAAWVVFARGRVLANRYARQAEHMTRYPGALDRDPDEGSLAWKLRKAGFRVGPNPEAAYFLLQVVLAAIAGAIGYAVGFPTLVCFAFAGIAYLAPSRIVSGRIRARAKAIDRALPIFYTRLAAVLQAQPHIQLALQSVTQSMMLEGESPLLQELQPVATAPDFLGALEELEKKAPTTSLASLAFALRRYHERGATSAFANTLASAAQRLTRIIGGRNKAQAKAGDARMSVYAIVGVLLFVYAMLLQDPSIKAGIAAPLSQIVLLILVGWMYIGLEFIQSIIEGVG